MPVAKTPSTTLSAANERTMERPKERWHSIIAPMAIVRTTNDARTGMGAIFGSSHVSNFIIKFIMLDVLHQLFSLISTNRGERCGLGLCPQKHLVQVLVAHRNWKMGTRIAC